MRSSGISPVAPLSGRPTSVGLSPTTIVGPVSDTTSASTGKSEIDSKLLRPLPRRDFGLAMADIGGTPFPLADMIAGRSRTSVFHVEHESALEPHDTSRAAAIQADRQ